MIILNFSHPLTATQEQAIVEMTGLAVTAVQTVTCQLDNSAEFSPQVRQLIHQLNLSPTTWQTERILIVPPGYAPATAVLLAELHGRMGYFPSLVRIRPNHTANEPYEVAEIINLQQLREQTRQEARK